MDTLHTFIQAGAVITGVGRFAVQKSVQTSRLFLASSLGLITADYLLAYCQTGKSVKMMGAVTLGTMFCRSLLLLSRRGQKNSKSIAGGAFLAGSLLAVSNQVIAGNISPSSILIIGGLGFGCLADYQETMKNRRACFFTMGVCSMGFALASGSWPLFINNLSADVIANGYFINKYDLTSCSADSPLKRIKSYFNDVIHNTSCSMPHRSSEDQNNKTSKTQKPEIK